MGFRKNIMNFFVSVFLWLIIILILMNSPSKGGGVDNLDMIFVAIVFSLINVGGQLITEYIFEVFDIRDD